MWISQKPTFPGRCKKRNVRIIGLDNNPAACSLFRKNALLNDIEAEIVLGDANSMGALFKKDFDRIVMPAPYGLAYRLLQGLRRRGAKGEQVCF